MKVALSVNQHGFARRHVAQELEAKHIKRHRLGRHQPFGAVRSVLAPDHHRSNAIRIAKAEQAVTCDHRHHRIRTTATAVYTGHRTENRILVKLEPVTGSLQFVRQHVEQHLGVTAGVDVAQVRQEHLTLERFGVRQIAVMRQEQTEGRVDVKRLRLGSMIGRTRSGIADVTDAPVTFEAAHIARTEHVAHQAGALVHVKASAFGGGNARRVLATVLQHLQPVIQQLVDRRGGNDPENSTHGNFAYLNRILSATTAGSQGLAATTAISSGGENNACVHQGA